MSTASQYARKEVFFRGGWVVNCIPSYPRQVVVIPYASLYRLILLPRLPITRTATGRSEAAPSGTCSRQFGHQKRPSCQPQVRHGTPPGCTMLPSQTVAVQHPCGGYSHFKRSHGQNFPHEVIGPPPSCSTPSMMCSGRAKAGRAAQASAEW